MRANLGSHPFGDGSFFVGGCWQYGCLATGEHSWQRKESSTWGKRVILGMPGKAKESRWLLVGDEVAPSASSIRGASKADSA